MEENLGIHFTGRPLPHMHQIHFDQNLAKGFIELWGMETVIANKLSRNLPTGEKGKTRNEKECKDCGASDLCHRIQ